MTALKDLLNHAAGDETNLSDADLAGFLHRGRRSARRRRFSMLAATSAATTAAVAVAWAVAPNGPQSEPDVYGGDGKATATPTAGNGPTGKPRKTPPQTELPAAPKPARPVELVPDGVVRAGTDVVCDLKPKGWRAHVKSYPDGRPGLLFFIHPTLYDTGQYSPSSTFIWADHGSFFRDLTGRMVVEQFGRTWDELKSRYRTAGNRTAVVSDAYVGPDTEANGMRHFHMRMTETELILVTNEATSLGWDLPTALRFVGSCHFSR